MCVAGRGGSSPSNCRVSSPVHQDSTELPADTVSLDGVSTGRTGGSMNDAERLAFAKRVMDRAWADLPPGIAACWRRSGPRAATPLLARSGSTPTNCAVLRATRVSQPQSGSAKMPLPSLDSRTEAGATQRRSSQLSGSRPAQPGMGASQGRLARVGPCACLSPRHERGRVSGPGAPRAGAPSMAENIRSADYRQREYTHEIVAEVHALLINRRRRGATGRPPWLSTEIYELVRRVVGWNQ
jgi:hypothetical protein